MRYFVRNLQGLYETLDRIPGPKALLDFLCGEMGYEVLMAQALGGSFYEKHKGRARVVACCWKGSALVYSNVSDDQIELDNLEVSTLGSRLHRGEDKWDWLVQQGHLEKGAALGGVIQRLGPYYWGNGAPDANRLQGVSAPPPLDSRQVCYSGFVKFISRRLVAEQFRFQPYGERLVQQPYISVFDRNETHQPHRNTQLWQIELMRSWAQKRGYRLVVISDLYPRPLPDDVIRFSPPHRDMEMLCNIVRYSTLHASPTCGAAEWAQVVGCHYLQLTPYTADYSPSLFMDLLKNRGFRYFGVFDKRNPWVEWRVQRYLSGKKDQNPAGETRRQSKRVLFGTGIKLFGRVYSKA